MRSVLLGLCLVSVLVAACSDSTDGKGVTGGDAGAAGEPSGGDAGAGDTGGGDAGAAGASSCAESGVGVIKLVVTGLPADVAASVTITGSEALPESESTTLSDSAAGEYTVTAKRVYDADALVRTAYEPSVSGAAFCLAEDGTQTVTVSYSAIPTSNQLWTINGNGDSAPLLGFASAKLVETATVPATTAADAAVARSLAFDYDGNLWAGGAPETNATLVRYPAAMLDGVGAPELDYALNVPAIDCVPAVRGVALDSSGNIWVSGCGKKVLRIDKPELAARSADVVDVEPGVTLSGFDLENDDLAFDGAGNLWLAAEGKLLRFDKARLAADDADAADLVLDVTTDDAEPKALAANFLTFDVSGNLWASDFAGNQVFEIVKADLTGSGAVTSVAKVHVSVDILAVMSRPAFDDEGSLWLTLAAGKFGKLTAEQLAVSSDAGAPTAPAVIIAGTGVGSADGLAFFPAASGLPLASAQP